MTTETPATLRLRAKAAEAFARAALASADGYAALADVAAIEHDTYMLGAHQTAVDDSRDRATRRMAEARELHEAANVLEATQAKGAA